MDDSVKSDVKTVEPWMLIVIGALGSVGALAVERQASATFAKILMGGIAFALPAYFGVRARSLITKRREAPTTKDKRSQ